MSHHRNDVSQIGSQSQARSRREDASQCVVVSQQFRAGEDDVLLRKHAQFLLTSAARKFLNKCMFQHGSHLFMSPRTRRGAPMHLQLQQGLNQRKHGGVHQGVAHGYVDGLHLPDTVKHRLQQAFVAENHRRLYQRFTLFQMRASPFVNIASLGIIRRRLDESDFLPFPHVPEQVFPLELVTQHLDVLLNELPSLIARLSLTSLHIGNVVVPIELDITVQLQVAEQLHFSLIEHVEAHHHISLRSQSPVCPFSHLLILTCQCFDDTAFQHTLIHHRIPLSCQQRMPIVFVNLSQRVP